MSVLKKIKTRAIRRVMRVRKAIRVRHDNTKLRVSLFRSLKYVFGQAIDDSKGITVASLHSKTLNNNEKKAKTAMAFLAGEALGKQLLEKGYNEVIFDRGQYNYHGRVKSFADGMRSSGILF